MSAACGTTLLACLAATLATAAGDEETAAVEGARAQLAAAERSHGPESLETANALGVLVASLVKSGAQKEAETRMLAERAVRLKEKLLPATDPGLEVSLSSWADLLKWNAEWENALTVYQRVLGIRISTRGAAHPDVATTLDAIGIVLRQMGRLEEAKQHLERSLQIREQSVGPEDPATATSLHLLGVVLHDQGELESAREHYERALEIRRRRLPADDPQIASTLSNLGAVESSRGRLSQARTLYEQALQIYERGPEELKAAETLANLGNLLKIMGDLEGARRCGERSRDIRKAHLGAENPFYGSSLKLLAEIATMTGDYPEALRLYGEVLRIWTASYGEKHAKIGQCLREQAILLDATGAHDEAGAKLQHAVDILGRALGQSHPEVTFTMDWLAAHHALVRDYEEAATTFQRSITIRSAAVDKDSLGLAWNQVDLAGALGHLGRDTEAGQLYAQGLSALRRILGEEHYDVARAMHAHANHLAMVGDWEAARLECEGAVRIVDATVGPDAPLKVLIQVDLATALTGLGRYRAAFETALEAESRGRKHAELVAQGFPERRAVGYATARSSGLAVAQALATTHAAAVPKAATRTWDAWIRSRALVLDEVATRNRGLERVDDAEVARLSSEFRSTRQRLANLEVRGPGAIPVPEYRGLVDESRAEKERLEQLLAAKSSGFRHETSRRQIGFDAVRAALPDASALVAFARCETRSLPERPSAAMHLAGLGLHTDAFYVVFVLRGKGPPLCVDLGAASSIETAIDVWRREVKAGLTALGDHDTSCRLAGEKLRSCIWDPIAPHLEGVKRVFIVPDGAVQLVTFAALPTARSDYLIESGPRLHYLSAERDLVIPVDRKPSNRGMLVLGNPDFAAREALQAHLDTGVNVGTALARSEAKDASPPPGSPPHALRSACPTFDTQQFPRLERSEIEASELAELYDSTRAARPASSDHAVLLIGARASEGAFKDMASGFRLLHLATHGFFLGAECPGSSPGARSITGLALETPSALPAWQENPLLHSGLVLAGADHRAAAGPDEEDGILTAEEIALLDLRGVEWAVLSACDTGLGAVVHGEGVFGLRRAFKVAGAGTLIMSLWPVHEETARMWMRSAYDGRLHLGLATDEAVHQATLTLLQWSRTHMRSDHPGLWAGFIAVGDWE